ncbi:MAG: 2-oxoacid:acceptor oxidoreductase subunit alpha [Candidatus Nealsonbacteria bacterium]|nr:2-oxoacid:acceptor oxidoreductase subunit alpha [Candidatus Nealsonbacteria bacterium]
MEKTILIGGEAGLGAAVTSHFIGKTFTNLGYYVFNYRDYPSLIRGGHNFNILKISDKPVYSHEYKYDFILALDQKTIDFHKKDLNKGGFAFGPKETDPIVQKLQGPKILANNVLIGLLFKYFGVDLNILFAAAEKTFGKNADMVKKSMQEGYQLGSEKEKLKKFKSRCFISGTEGMGIGAIAAGIDVYLAYPMTPASPLLHFLAKRQLENNILVFQPENEIAVINAALGASFAGAKAMVGTSGGGFALMAEGLSLAAMTELPLVVYLGQRPAPATGLATHTGQGDLKFALNAGHGEFLRVVLAPGDAQEAISRTQEAFYLSSKYRIPVIILGDKHLAESNYTFNDIEKSSLAANRFILENPPQNYKSYKITENGVSPRAVPGQGPIVLANSYEHNDYGHTIEDPVWAVKMQDKRFKKLNYLKKEIDKLNPVSLYGKGSNLLISHGSTKGAILDALPQLKGFRFLQISYLKPFPAEMVAKEIKKSKKVILVENDARGALADVIREETGIAIENKVLRYDGRPFTPDFLIDKIKKSK